MPTTLPPRPELVFRIAFAGNRDLPTDDKALAKLRGALDRVLAVVAERLRAPSAVVAVAGQPVPPSVTAYYAATPPVLRLLTGLAEGADNEAAEALLRRQETEKNRPNPICAELAAVLGCAVKAYRASRVPAHQPLLDALLPKCRYVLALDGTYIDKPKPPINKDEKVKDPGFHHRARQYRGQATFLLRHADVLLAMADPQKAGSAGGTLETVRKALAFGLPVVFINTADASIAVIEPGRDDADGVLLQEPLPASAQPWDQRLDNLVQRLIAGPDLKPKTATPAKKGLLKTWMEFVARWFYISLPPKEDRPETDLLDAYFGHAHVPPTGPKGRIPSFLERRWARFERWFEPKPPPPPAEPVPADLNGAAPHKSEAPHPAYAAYRARATGLNYHYAGLYRGGFWANYVLAVAAVLFAALSLVFLTNPYWKPWAERVVPVLGLGKLMLVGLIIWISHRAHHHQWNNRAVAYRYLAERLRTLLYLPRLGSFRPPPPEPFQYASRESHQSVIDWLFTAIVRAVPPESVEVPIAWLSADDKKADDEKAADVAPPTMHVVTIDAAKQLSLIEQAWVTEQANYHDKTAKKKLAMNSRLGDISVFLNWSVVLCVVIDLYLAVAIHFHWLDHQYHAITPWLILVAVVLPATVASFNGIRFQSEAKRLSQRSAVARELLNGRLKEIDELRTEMNAVRGTDDDLGSWNVPVMRLGEAIASDLTQEVAEWSALYSKEFLEA